MNLSIEKILNDLSIKKDFRNVTNQYSDNWPYNKIAKENLRLYFTKMKELKPKFILIGEAPGYNGCRLTGIPFTSEFIIQDEIKNIRLFGINNGYRTRNTAMPQKEPTATIVWEFLNTVKMYPLLWNAFPFHPYKSGNKDSNRNGKDLTNDELEFGLYILRKIFEEFDIRKGMIVAVGRTSFNLLRRNGMDCSYIRHPSHGGKDEFIDGLEKLFCF